MPDECDYSKWCLQPSAVRVIKRTRFLWIKKRGKQGNVDIVIMVMIITIIIMVILIL